MKFALDYFSIEKINPIIIKLPFNQNFSDLSNKMTLSWSNLPVDINKRSRRLWNTTSKKHIFTIVHIWIEWLPLKIREKTLHFLPSSHYERFFIIECRRKVVISLVSRRKVFVYSFLKCYQNIFGFFKIYLRKYNLYPSLFTF